MNMSIIISTGLVKATIYAAKIRRVLIAATKIRGVPVEEAIRVSAYINQQLFKIMRALEETEKPEEEEEIRIVEKKKRERGVFARLIERIKSIFSKR